jgi:hypothetical protein
MVKIPLERTIFPLSARELKSSPTLHNAKLCWFINPMNITHQYVMFRALVLKAVIRFHLGREEELRVIGTKLMIEHGIDISDYAYKRTSIKLMSDRIRVNLPHSSAYRTSSRSSSLVP